jgi:hypothetical protein
VITGNAVINGAITGVTNLSVSGTTAINTSGITTSGTQLYSGAATLTAATTLSASGITTGSTLAASTFALTLTTDALALGGNFSGSGALVIQPKTATTTIGLGTSASGSLHLSDTELGYLQDGFSSITLGSTTGTGAIAYTTAADYAFTDPLTIRSNTGTITATTALNTGANSLTITSGGAVSLAAITSGTLAITGTGITLNGDITTSGTQTYTGAVTLGNSVNLASTGASSTGNNIGFSSTVAGAKALAVDAGVGSITFSGVVGGTPLTSLQTTSSHSSGTNIAANITTTGTQQYTGAVTLTGTGATRTLQGSTVTTSSTIAGGTNSFTITGNAVFSGAITGVTNLSVSGTSSIGANITTTGTQGYTGAVTLASPVTLTTTNNLITFSSTVDSDSSTARNLTTSVGNNGVTFTGAVGGSQGLGNISLTGTGTTTFSSTVAAASLIQNSTSGTTAINGASINTTGGAQTYNNAVTLGGSDNKALTATTVTFNSTVSGAFGLAITGNAVFGNETTDTVTISGSSKNLSVSGTTGIYTNAITTSGSQTFTGAVTVATATTLSASAITTDSTITASANNLTLTTDAISIGGAISGSGALVIQPKTNSTTVGIGSAITDTSCGGAVCALNISDTELAFLPGTFLSITLGSTTGTGAMAINTAYTFTDPLTIRSNTGTITATSALNTGTNSLTISSGGAVTVEAITSGTLAITGTGITLNSDITTSGTQTYTGAVTLAGGDRVLTVTNNAILFSSTIDSDATLTPRSLTISAGSGNTTFSGAIGATYALNALRVNGTVTMGDNITTAGTQDFTGNVIISGSNVNLSSMGNSGTGSTITFGGNINGSVADSNNLYLLSGAGEISVAGNVGNTTGLGYLALGGYGISTSATTQGFSYTGAVQTFTTSTAATYTLQVWGAQGGNDPAYPTTVFGGRGGYTTGQLMLNAGTTLYIYVGSQGTGSTSSYWASTGGGGATDIRITGGSWNDATGLLSRIIVAGGGGGRHGQNYEGVAYLGNDGGGLTAPSYTTNGYSVTGAGQSSGGTSNYGYAVTPGLFGYAVANGMSNTYSAGGWNGGGAGSDGWANGGAGGGWYGGVTTWSAGSGGSGYVLTSSSVKPAGYVPGSAYYMSSTEVIAGNATIPNPAGGTMTGKTGNGYASITTTGANTFTSGSQTGKISISGSVKATTLNTANTAFELVLGLANNSSTIGSATTFNNTGALTLG